MILDFAKDPNEYVSRRALLAMPALRPDCVEQFAPLFWSHWTPSIPSCFHNTWSRPSRMVGAICWNTPNESKEDLP